MRDVTQDSGTSVSTAVEVNTLRFDLINGRYYITLLKYQRTITINVC